MPQAASRTTSIPITEAEQMAPHPSMSSTLRTCSHIAFSLLPALRWMPPPPAGSLGEPGAVGAPMGHGGEFDKLPVKAFRAGFGQWTDQTGHLTLV